MQNAETLRTPVVVCVSVSEKALDYNMSQACHDIDTCRAGKLLLYNRAIHEIALFAVLT